MVRLLNLRQYDCIVIVSYLYVGFPNCYLPFLRLYAFGGHSVSCPMASVRTRESDSYSSFIHASTSIHVFCRGCPSAVVLSDAFACRLWPVLSESRSGLLYC